MTTRALRSLAVSIALLLSTSACADLLEILGVPQDPPCADSVLGCPTAAGNNFSNPYNPIIAGLPVVCTSATGQPVATILNPNLNDIGRARPGVPPTIELNPTILTQLPQKVQLFWYGHECAHHVLGHTIGFLNFTSEGQADCWAVQIGKLQGFLNRSEVVAFEPYFRNLTGSVYGHLPGPQRAALLVQCWDAG